MVLELRVRYPTIENQEKSRKDKIRDDIEAALRAAERAEPTVLLISLLEPESRIYSPWDSKGLVDSMFCNPQKYPIVLIPTKGAFTIEDSNVPSV